MEHTALELWPIGRNVPRDWLERFPASALKLADDQIQGILQNEPNFFRSVYLLAYWGEIRSLAEAALGEL